MLSIKESTIELIKKLPEDCSMEDIQYELYVKSKIEAGLKDIDEGHLLSEEDMDKEINRWLH